MCGVAFVRSSDRNYSTLLIVFNDPSDTPFPVTVKTLFLINRDRLTQQVTIPSNKTMMWDSQIHLMFPLNCQLLFTTSMSVPSLLWTIQVQCHTDTKMRTILMMCRTFHVVYFGSWRSPRGWLTLRLFNYPKRKRSVVADAETKAWSCGFVLMILGQNKPHFSLPESNLPDYGCV